jgi:hypothetical protein
MIESPKGLRDHIDSLPYTAQEIDRGLLLLTDPAGRTLGGTLELDHLDGWHLALLSVEDMIGMSDSGWKLSPRGQLLSDLLDRYAQATFRTTR